MTCLSLYSRAYMYFMLESTIVMIPWTTSLFCGSIVEDRPTSTCNQHTRLSHELTLSVFVNRPGAAVFCQSSTVSIRNLVWYNTIIIVHVYIWQFVPTSIASANTSEVQFLFVFGSETGRVKLLRSFVTKPSFLPGSLHVVISSRIGFECVPKLSFFIPSSYLCSWLTFTLLAFIWLFLDCFKSFFHS